MFFTWSLFWAKKTQRKGSRWPDATDVARPRSMTTECTQTWLLQPRQPRLDTQQWSRKAFDRARDPQRMWILGKDFSKKSDFLKKIQMIIFALPLLFCSMYSPSQKKVHKRNLKHPCFLERFLKKRFFVLDKLK